MIASTMLMTVWAILGVVGICGAAMYAGLETGTYAVNKVRLELRTAEGDGQAVRLSRMLANPPQMLATLLIGTNAMQNLAIAGSVAVLHELGASNPDALTTLVMTPVLFVLAEMLPKNLFRISAEWWTYHLSRFLSVSSAVCRYTGLSPLVSGFSRGLVWLWHGRGGEKGPLEPRQRVRSFLAEGYAHGVLSEAQSTMAEAVISLGSTPLSQVMVPLGRVVAIAEDCTRAQFEQALRDHSFSRVPVYRDQRSNIIGLVNIYDVLLDPDTTCPPAKHIQPALTLAEEADVAKALVTMQRARRPMAVVIGHGGRAVGVVTMKDLAEQIVGELAAW